MSGPRLRFAIPPGAAGLAIGSARDALFSWLFARSRGGTFLLRNDVTSSTRMEAERRAIDDLSWLGLGWDEGIDAGGERGPYRRSDRLHLYAAMADDLLRRGLAYRCFCPPLRQAENGSPVPCDCRETAAEVAAERQDARARSILLHTAVGDVVLEQRDGGPGPRFATALDDVMMGITHVVSTAERPPAASRRAALHAAVGEGPGPRFIDLPPIDPPGERASRPADRMATIERFRREGYPPEGVLNLLAQLGAATNGGQGLLTREEMLAGFDPERVCGERPTFDPQRLRTLAARHMARMPPQRLAELAAEHLAGAGLLRQPPSPEEYAWGEGVARLFIDRLARMSDLPAAAEPLFRFDPGASLRDPVVCQTLREPASRRVIETALSEVGEEELTAAHFQTVAAAVRRATGAKGKGLWDPLRIALTGRPAGPDLAQLIVLIERGRNLPLPRRVAGCAERARSLLEATAQGAR